MISWKLRTDFDKQKHLFSGKVETEYIIETYICACGHTKFIIKNSAQKIDYVCNKCDNNNFYDANLAWEMFHIILPEEEQAKLSHIFYIEEEKQKIRSIYSVLLPRDIDYMAKKVLYKERFIASLTLTSEGQLYETETKFFKSSNKHSLYTQLEEYIQEHGCFDIPKYQNLNLDKALFFLKNRHLKDCDFYYWSDYYLLPQKDLSINDALDFISNHSKSKLVKEALYKNYTKQLEKNGLFYAAFVYVLCKNIENIQILAQLLQIDFDTSLYEIYYKDFEKFLCFLQQNYSEIELLNLFKFDVVKEPTLFEDTLYTFLLNDKKIVAYFQKVPCKLQALNNEIKKYLT